MIDTLIIDQRIKLGQRTRDNDRMHISSAHNTHSTAEVLERSNQLLNGCLFLGIAHVRLTYLLTALQVGQDQETDRASTGASNVV